jgi:hypothetical protein
MKGSIAVLHQRPSPLGDLLDSQFKAFVRFFSCFFVQFILSNGLETKYNARTHDFQWSGNHGIYNRHCNPQSGQSRSVILDTSHDVHSCRYQVQFDHSSGMGIIGMTIDVA